MLTILQPKEIGSLFSAFLYVCLLSRSSGGAEKHELAIAMIDLSVSASRTCPEQILSMWDKHHICQSWWLNLMSCLVSSFSKNLVILLLLSALSMVMCPT